MIKLRTLFLATCLVLEVACQSIPKPPAVEQDAYSWKFKKFRACNTETHQCRNVTLDDPSMEAAQCLNGQDFKAMNAWVDQLIDLLQQRKFTAVQPTEE